MWLNWHADMEYEEERGRSGEEEAEDERSADPSAERCVHTIVNCNPSRLNHRLVWACFSTEISSVWRVFQC